VSFFPLPNVQPTAMNHDSIEGVLDTLLEGFCENVWQPLKYNKYCCHLSADMIVWLLAHEFRFVYAGTMLFTPLTFRFTSSLGPRDVAQRLSFATSLRAPSLQEPVAMGTISMVCETRRDFHSIAFVVHGGEVMVLQADRNRFSLCDWTDEDGSRLPQHMRAAHRVYGGMQWVPVARFMTDISRGEYEPLCGMRCPRVLGLSLLVHKRVLGTRASRGFDDEFWHGERVRFVLRNLIHSEGQKMMAFMNQLGPSDPSRR
jgi:hypothetical protein